MDQKVGATALVGRAKLCYFVVWRRTQVSWFVESGAANERLGCLCFKQARQKFVAEDQLGKRLDREVRPLAVAG